MPQKRKDPDEAGVAKPDLEARSVESVPKKSVRRTSAKSSSESDRKHRSTRTRPAPTVQEPASPAKDSSNAAILASGTTLRERIALLAYSYWEARGFQPGNPEEDWFRAEREILNQMQTDEGKS